MYEINICVLYPELFNLCGDRANVIALKKRAQWREISVTVTNVSFNENFISEDYDIVFLGGNQDYELQIIQNDFIKNKGNEIINAIETNKVFLCLCGGYQLLGKYYRSSDGKEIEMLGALDLWTIACKQKLIGNLIFECNFLNTGEYDGKVVAFENHSCQTCLGQSIEPLGHVLKGFGNNGEDGFEGARYKNVFCSNSHGSLLPINPELADYILTAALKEKYPNFPSLTPLNNEFEDLARTSIIQRFI